MACGVLMRTIDWRSRNQYWRFPNVQCSHALSNRLPDLSLILALVRGGTLARAARCCGWMSTVFRAVRRLEAALGQTLFKSRAGYPPTGLASNLAQQAERAEQALKPRGSAWSRAVK
jgi:hypothetical protein